MEDALDQLIVCQDLYSKILEELKSRLGSSWDQHKTLFHNIIQKEISLFLNFLECQKTDSSSATHLEFAWSFQNRIIKALQQAEIQTEIELQETAKNLTEIMHKEVQRQMYFQTTPFSMY